MRSIQQIEQNISTLNTMLSQLSAQISLFENEYQTSAIELTGERNEEWDKNISDLYKAFHALNNLYHMEIDYVGSLKYPDED